MRPDWEGGMSSANEVQWQTRDAPPSVRCVCRTETNIPCLFAVSVSSYLLHIIKLLYELYLLLPYLSYFSLPH